ncbi:MAG: UDP-N-acetylmuramoyl-tripeptide--D-alanyl-D-alanine ligase [Anaerolineales bacterium]|nr:MAG: UDP-N-acetylmuramoyl-tripeptide--D-alanyl-D-alanine ligase [Anaerolineales bacterium]
MLTLAELLADLDPALRVEGAEKVPVGEVCIDSRQAGPDCLFVALRGENTDGHLYVHDAFDAGAVVALVERPVAGVATIDTVRGTAPRALTVPVAVVVGDSLAALQRLAQARRLARPALRVVAITGSIGKTTTKEAVAAVLSQRYATLKSAGNYNSEIGLPLTLMGLQAQHERAVLEMGMYDLGEIALLCRIARPQVGVVTNVGPAHLERLGTIERIAQAKAELVEALPSDGVAVLNGDDARVRAMGQRTGARVITFGLGRGNTVWADDINSCGLEGVRFQAHLAQEAFVGIEPRSRSLKLATLGRHMVHAGLAAVAVGLLEGLTWGEVEQGLLAQGYGLRLVPKPGIRGSTLLDDTYNASPASVGAALDVLAELPGRRVAALGDMAELGSYEAQAHREVGRRCAAVVDVLVTVGGRGRLIAEAALEAGLPLSAVHAVADNRAAVEVLSALLREGDGVLVKGSRSMAMEAIVSALEEEEA